MKYEIIKNCEISDTAKLSPFINLYGCEIDDEAFIGPFVEIQKGAKVGRRTRISSHTFICEGVYIGSDCFIGHHVVFTNDNFNKDKKDWVFKKTLIGDSVRIGSNATLLPVNVGDGAVIGAGSVVTKDVRAGSVVYGNPAREK